VQFEIFMPISQKKNTSL